jgi:uncharacterized protein YqgC (DUF456 family)
MNEMTIVLSIVGVILILAGLISLIYQFFSSSTLTILGVICLNYAWHWFSWNWMIWFVILWLIAILCGFLITASESKKTVQSNNYWMPVLGSLLGATFIPIPFLGALIGVFLGTLIAFLVEDPVLNREKMELALNVTFKSFLGLVIEVSAVLTMVISLIALAVF